MIYKKQAFAWAVFTRHSKDEAWLLHSMHWDKPRAMEMAAPISEDDYSKRVPPSTVVRRVRWQFADKPPKRPTFNRDK